MTPYIGLKIGSYYHIANNFHYYESKKDMIEALASTKEYREIPYTYDKSFSSLEEFDSELEVLEREESLMREKYYTYNPKLFKDSFFKDWYSMLCKKNAPSAKVTFTNKSLNELLKKTYEKA